MSYAIDMGFWDRIQPKIRQWEITHGTPMPKDQYQALIEGGLGVATKESYDRAARNEALALDRERLDSAKEQADKADRAATVKGAVDIVTTAGTGYLGYKQLGILDKSAASNAKMADAISAKYGAKPALDIAAPSTATTAAVPATAGALDLGSTGVFSAPTAEAAGFNIGAQATLAKTAPAIATETSFAAEAATTEAIAAGTEGTAAAGGATMAGVGLAGAAGYGAGYLLSKITGANEDISEGMEFGLAGAGIGGYLAAGTAMGGPVGAVLGLAVGVGVSLFDDSVICSELLRQGRITPLQRKQCVLFRFRHINDEMFDAYLEWARPHVAAMRRRGWRNVFRLPFAHAFVGYMLAIQEKRYPSFLEKTVWNYAWRRCEAIAARANACGEVIHVVS